MASSSALSFLIVSVRRGARLLVPNTAIKSNSEETYSDLFERVQCSQSQVQGLDVDDVIRVRLYDLRKTSADIVVESMDLPLSVGDDVGLKGVEFHLQERHGGLPPLGRGLGLEDSTATGRNAFDMLMTIRHEVPAKVEEKDGKGLTSFEKMKNDVVDWCAEHGAGWTSHSMESGQKVVKALTSALWYLESHHQKFEAKGLAIPKTFSSFQGYRDFAKLHRKAPRLSQETLSDHCNQLAAAMSLPSMATTHNQVILNYIEALTDSMVKYRDHMKGDNTRHAEKRRQPPALTSVEPDRDVDLLCLASVPRVNERYKALDAALSAAEAYEFLDLPQFSPDDRIKRRRYVKDLQVSMPVVLFRVAYGGSLGTLNFVWRTDEGDSESERMARNSDTAGQVKATLPKFCSRAIRRDFLQKYCRHVKAPKSILRHMFKELTGCDNAPETATMAKSYEQAAEFLLGSDDPDVVLDYRSANGGSGETHFEEFFAEVERYFDEQLMPVHERRETSQLYLPLAISVADLRREVSKRLPEGTPVPSTEMLRLQFHPLNQHVRTAERLTGRFNVKFRVQSRLARLHHPDARYVSTQYQYLKDFEVRYRQRTIMVCLDDKAVVPVGEPGFPVSTGVRPHNRVLAPVDGAELVAGDHDYHISGLVPSVAFILEIPEDSRESFFQGQGCVTTKDKIFQPSNPLRHATELMNIMSSLDTPEQDEGKSVLIVFTDGGPDHRVTYDTVKLSLLSIFMEMDLDMLIALRTAPNNSWVNPAERLMSVLNLALQHVALERKPMPENFEKKMKNKSSLGAVRNQAEYTEGFQEAYTESVRPVIDLVNDRFGRMNVKGVPLKTFNAASVPDIEHSLDVPKRVTSCDALTPESKTKDVRSCKQLQDFLKQHGKSGHYCFQLKKCSDFTDCTYCSENPVRMDQDTFESLHFLPDPVPDDSGEAYQTFTQLYGQNTTDRHRPSLLGVGASPEDQDADKRNTEIMKRAKVRSSISCVECGKPRCIYTPKSLTPAQESQLQQLKDELWYVCGDPLDENSPFVARRAISCSTVIEPNYYSAPCYLPPVCCQCGNDDDLLGDFSEYMQQMSEQWSVMRPLCQDCHARGKESTTWGRKFFKKRRT